jgi:hypothetical protein
MKLSDFIIGLALVVLGLIFMFQNFGYIDLDFAEVWPLFVMFGGIAFWVGYFRNKKDYGLLMPGTILIVYGLMFWYCALEGWWYMQFIWPGFLIGPGLGFVFMYALGTKEQGLLIPGGILLGLGIIMLAGLSPIFRYWPLLLIVAGAYLIYRHTKAKQNENE